MDREPEYAKAAYPDEPARNSKLPLMNQEKLISQLTELTHRLEERLTSVLTPEEPQPERAASYAETTKSPVQSPLAGQLEDNNFRITKVNTRLTGILERLEV